MEHINMPIDEIAEKVYQCINKFDADIDPEEVVTILSIAYPGYDVFYSDEEGDLLSGIVQDINVNGLIFDHLDYVWVEQLDLYFLIQKTHRR
jgi:hypothetical protein